jgi:ribosome-associated toxin RatA of RatAB toxin-antitoxin module
MIKKVARVDAPIEVVRSMFVDVANWTKWMPGVQSVRILEESDKSTMAEMKQIHMGRQLSQTLEFRFHASGMKQTQVEGWFKSWEADWRFIEPPDKSGTTISLALELDMGMLGLFASGRMIQKSVDQMFAEMTRNVERRALAASVKRRASIGSEGPLLELFQTETGLELWFEGRQYFLQPAD